MGLFEKELNEVNFPIAKIVRKLMEHANMSEADLSRGVNLPQTTINRLLTGQTTDPRVSTLVAIAQFFEISLEQVLGRELLVLNSNCRHGKSSTIPVVPWECLQEFFCNKLKNENCLTTWLKTEKLLNPGSFALTTPVSCASIFGEASTLVLNRLTEESQILDGQITLVEVESGQFCLRKVLKDGAEYYLKRLFSPFDIEKTNDKTIFHACVVEARNDKFSI